MERVWVCNLSHTVFSSDNLALLLFHSDSDNEDKVTDSSISHNEFDSCME